MPGYGMLIGWYKLEGEQFCFKEDKHNHPDIFKEYTMPVYAIHESGMRKDLLAENAELKKELKENAAFVYNQAILATPTGDLRNKLTILNIQRLDLLTRTEQTKEEKNESAQKTKNNGGP